MTYKVVLVPKRGSSQLDQYQEFQDLTSALDRFNSWSNAFVADVYLLDGFDTILEGPNKGEYFNCHALSLIAGLKSKFGRITNRQKAVKSKKGKMS